MSEHGKTQEMNEARLAAIVAAHGAAPHRWPEAERQAAIGLLSRSAEARAMLDAEAELDALLGQVPDQVAPSAILVERLIAARPRAVPPPVQHAPRSRASGWRILWPYGSPLIPTSALACSMLLGLVLGTSLQSESTEPMGITQADSEQLVMLALAEINYPEEWQP